MNLIELLERGAGFGAARPALVLGDDVVSYGALQASAGALAASLRERGVRPGDRVALLVPNQPEYVVACYGILGAGAVVVPINARARAPEIAHILADGEITAAIAHAAALPELRAAQADGPRLRQTIVLGGPADAGEVAYEALLQAPAALDPAATADDTLAMLIYTSGTTGRPKGVMLTHHALAHNAACTSIGIGMSEADRLLAVAPLGHILGCSLAMNGSLYQGAVAVFVPALDADTVLATIERQRCTVLGAVPTLLAMLVQHSRRYDVSSLRIALVGGSACPEGLLDRVEREFGWLAIEGYGATEAGGGISTIPLKGPYKRGSVGLAQTNNEVAALDDSGQAVAAGTVGELCLRGPTIMQGYWHQPAATAETIVDGWLHTGDVGYIDADGFIWIVDRKKDVVITSGFNVYPREVEDTLYTHPAVAEAAVVGVPDPLKGELVCACVVLHQGQQASEAELIAWCKARLTPYKAPVQITFLDSLPKGGSGKILRRELRAQLAAPPECRGSPA